jgi:rhamnulokinase
VQSIRGVVAAHDLVPVARAELARCILDGVAAAFGRAVRDVARLSGRSVEVVHLMAGGAPKSLLCVAVTALGNVPVQARARGLIAGNLERLRALVSTTQDIRHYEPRTSIVRRRA